MTQNVGRFGKASGFCLASRCLGKVKGNSTHGARKPKQVCETGTVIENCCGEL